MALSSAFLKFLGKVLRSAGQQGVVVLPVTAALKRLKAGPEFKASVGQIMKLPSLGLQG